MNMTGQVASLDPRVHCRTLRVLWSVVYIYSQSMFHAVRWISDSWVKLHNC